MAITDHGRAPASNSAVPEKKKVRKQYAYKYFITWSMITQQLFLNHEKISDTQERSQTKAYFTSTTGRCWVVWCGLRVRCRSYYCYLWRFVYNNKMIHKYTFVSDLSETKREKKLIVMMELSLYTIRFQSDVLSQRKWFSYSNKTNHKKKEGSFSGMNSRCRQIGPNLI